MKLTSTRLLLIILTFFCLLPIDAIAGVFDPPVTDKSVEYLSQIFGGKMGSLQLGTNVQPNLLLNNLFNAFNGIVLSIAVIILTYVGSLSVLHTAHEGEVMGKKWSSIWIPLRSSVGLLLLAPIPGSGYSLIQVTVMWIVLNGIGAADSIWNMVLATMGTNAAKAAQTQIQNSDLSTLEAHGKTTASQILQSLVCVNLLNNKLDSRVSQTVGGLTTYYDTPQKNGLTKTGKLNFGINDPGNKARKDICGAITISASLEPLKEYQPLNQAQQEQLLDNAYAIKQQTLNSMIGVISPVANSIATNSPANITTNPAGMLYSSVAGYISSMSTLDRLNLPLSVGAVPIQTNSSVKELEKAGWLLAGSTYITLTKSTNQILLNTAKTNMPAASFLPNNLSNALLGSQTTSATFLTELDNYMQALQPQKTRFLFDKVSGSNVNGFHYLFVDRSFLALITVVTFGLTLPLLIFNEIGVASFSGILNAQPEEPLVTLGIAGRVFMSIAEALWLSFLAGAIMITLATAGASCVSPLGYATAAGLTIAIPVVMALIFSMWSIGAMMTIYLPLVPFMIFSVAALGWMISVIEAIVAAPIVSLGLIMPAQEEIGAIKPALGMITGIFLRPMLMVIGLIFASLLLKIGVASLSEGFKNALSGLEKQVGGFSAFSWIALIGLYLGFATTLVNKCYSLIYHLPDRVLGWIGIQGEKTDVSDVQGAKKGMDSSNKTASDISGGITDGSNKLNQDNLKERSNFGRGDPVGKDATGLAGGNKPAVPPAASTGGGAPTLPASPPGGAPTLPPGTPPSTPPGGAPTPPPGTPPSKPPGG